MESIYFISGMPRSGSTLLANLLNQNPRFKATATSGLCNVFAALRDHWATVPELQAMQEEESIVLERRCLASLIDTFHENVEQPVVFDKSRGWVSEIETLEWVLEREVKILVPVRPLMDILCSFEKLYRKQKPHSLIPQARRDPVNFETVQGRCDYLLQNREIIGAPINKIRDARARGFTDRLHFVEFERLTSSPGNTMREIYDFLDESPFKHDFGNVEQTTHENDRVYGWGDLHTIRPSVGPVVSEWKEMLAPYLRPNVLAAYKADNLYWKGE